MVSGTEEIVAFGEAGYNGVYDELFSLIQADIQHPEHGSTVLGNIQAMVS